MLTQGWRVVRALLPQPDVRCLVVPALQSGLQDRAVLWPRAEVAGTALGRQVAGWMKCVAPCAPRPAGLSTASQRGPVEMSPDSRMISKG